MLCCMCEEEFFFWCDVSERENCWVVWSGGRVFSTVKAFLFQDDNDSFGTTYIKLHIEDMNYL